MLCQKGQQKRMTKKSVTSPLRITLSEGWGRGSCNIWYTLALRKAQIGMISFQTCTQMSGIHKVLIHVMRYKLSRQKVSTCV